MTSLKSFKVDTKCGQLLFKQKHEFTDKDGLWEAHTDVGTIVLRIVNGETGIRNFKNRFVFSCLRGIDKTSITCNECNQRYDYQVIPQYSIETGRCWWTSMMICLTYPKQLREIFINSLKKKLPIAQKHVLEIISGNYENCLNNSEFIRKLVYKHFKVGDNPSIKPELEGKNGMLEMVKLLHALDVPVTILQWDGKKFNTLSIFENVKKKPEILIIHVLRSRWTPAKVLHVDNLPIVNNPGGDWNVQSVLLGNEDAKHQIGASSCDGDVSQWIIGDSDAALLGINSTWISCQESKWVDALNSLFPILSKRSLTSFAPGNFSESCVNEEKGCDLPGRTNTDWIYVRNS